MKLTLFTDYSMRVLLYLGAQPDRLCSIGEVAQAYRVSQNHMMKVVNQLVRQGYVESVRGRSGGIRLGRAAEDINLGALIRATGVLGEALGAFLAVLDRYTLADMLTSRLRLAELLLAEPAPA